MAQATLSYPFGAIHLENRRGRLRRAPSRSGRSKSPHPLDPHLRGTPSWFLGSLIRRAKSEWSFRFFPGHWALVPSKFGWCSGSSLLRLPGQNQGSWAVAPGRWGQLVRHRGRMGHPPLRKEKKVGATEHVTPTNIFLTGAEAKRSFAQSSLPSFLSRKRRGI